ncbi:metallophosphoesterase [Achromobacter piechaudii]|uniref:3',5'-cyclic adenosine monophosphate phosphodiesterase CpdA n=1 Tax=Achromobacter piechaudii TaxID=72556 RepID=A0ABN7EWR1_9BURK|nr:metallophosphoesterase [Achromobacter piechaudii]CAB3683674.1 3',5'-cyclic adenosine monophosphate phosphodiesterase CpdA [Achromobacter piechaudii]CAB3869223.1 3',5'-cyclic adenosine monophosphate phosphodiesterase CpdA [Achromobacter piechaudii]CAB3948257.1 3',5'-cyclic adenosine monophosphate phosphodiesterase CpdA [Achromobacter piechaudii]
MFHVFTGLISLYVIWRFVLPLSLSRPAKILLSLFLLGAAEHHLVTRNFFGSMASPEVPGTLLMVLGWLFGALLLLAMLLLLRDVAGVVVYAFSRPRGRRLLAARAWGKGAAVLALMLSAIGVWQAVRVPDVKTLEIALPKLPPELDGFRLVQLTDLHASRLLEAPWIDAVVKKTNGLDPDLIVITGDLVDGTTDARAADVRPLQALRARHGVYAIPGNHEYYAQYARWLPAFEQLGLRLLLNEHVTLTPNGQRLVLAGITDKMAAAYDEPVPDAARALNGVPKTDPVILLSHRPIGAAQNARLGAGLQLSGHTHGGQILGPHLLTQLANEGYVSGQYEVDGMQMYVSNGTGLWPGFPIRLGRPSEITQIVLRSPARVATP